MAVMAKKSQETSRPRASTRTQAAAAAGFIPRKSALPVRSQKGTWAQRMKMMAPVPPPLAQRLGSAMSSHCSGKWCSQKSR